MKTRNTPRNKRGLKDCTQCGQEKPLNSYHKDCSRPDGHRSVCKECYNKAAKKYRERNRKKINRQNREWYKRNRGKRAVKNARQRARKKDALPCWADQKKIAMIYNIAKELENAGERLHIDHIIPLSHPNVCGLHVIANLQILTDEENISKGNSFDGTHENETWRLKYGYERVTKRREN